MLTPEYLDTLPDTLVSLWQRVEDDILRDIARRVGKMDTVTETAAWQLWRLEQTRALRTDIVRLLAKYSGKSDTEIRRLLQEAGTRTLASDDALYQAMGLDPPNVNTSPALLNLLNAGYRQTRGTWQNFTRTTANTVTRQFENALDRAWLQVSSGAFDYKTAIKRAVDGLSQDMKYITYPTGHRDTLEVAVRRAVLTGVNQTACKLQIARADEMGCEFVEVSAHSGARSDGSRGPRDHAWWQGKVYHRGSTVEYNGERYESFEDATGYGTGEGLCGWNCRHNFHPFWPGISVPNYTPERLAELNARNIGYNGKMYTRYEINQQQRALERRVRAAKRKYLAESAAGVDATQAAVQLKQARRKLKAFVQATGGRTDSGRESVNGFGRSQASKATLPERRSLPSFGVPSSVGAKRKNYDILDKASGITYHLIEGTHFQNVEIFAGKGVSTPLREAVREGLAEEFGGSPTDWQHVKGFATLQDDEFMLDEREAEVHWFQLPSGKKIKFLIKRWLDE